MKPRIYRQFEEDLETGTRILWRLESTERKMAAQLPGDLKGTDYDREGKGSTAWCDLHEREVTACHRSELYCLGAPLPNITDPTGDAAVNDRVWSDARAMTEHARKIHHHLEAMLSIVVRYDVEDPTPDEREERDRRNSTVWCERHLRYGYEEPADTGVQGSRVPDGEGGHVLKDPKRLCQWCRKTTKVLGHLPTEQQVHDHKLGKRLRISA